MNPIVGPEEGLVAHDGDVHSIRIEGTGGTWIDVPEHVGAFGSAIRHPKLIIAIVWSRIGKEQSITECHQAVQRPVGESVDSSQQRSARAGAVGPPQGSAGAAIAAKEEKV